MKKTVCIMALIVFLLGSGLSVFAEETVYEELPTEEEYLQEIYESLPEEIRDSLSEDSDSLFTPEKLASLGETFLSDVFAGALRYGAKFLFMILAAALIASFRDAFESKGQWGELITLSLLFILLFPELLSLCEVTESYLKKMQGFLTSFSMTMSSVLLLGGNTLSSAAMLSTLSFFSLLLESGCLAFLFPMVRLSLTATAAGLFNKGGFDAIGRIARSVYSRLVGILSFAAVLLMTYQTALTAAKDSLATRTIRYAITSSLPIVGGTVGDSFHTLASSLQVIRASVGGVGILAILLLALYPLGALLSLQLPLFCAEEIAKSLELPAEQRLFCEARQLVNMLIAVVILVAIVFIFSAAVWMMMPLAIG